YVEFNIDQVFESLKIVNFIAAKKAKDRDFVTRGMNEMTLKFLRSQNGIKNLKKKDPPSGPYMNVLGLNLQKVRSNELVKKYIDHVDKSNGIYSHRWGDLPLWGEVIHYILGEDSFKLDVSLKYYHESHHKQIN